MDFSIMYDNPNQSDVRLGLCTLPEPPADAGGITNADGINYGITWLHAHKLVLTVASEKFNAQLVGSWASPSPLPSASASAPPPHPKRPRSERTLIECVEPGELEAAKKVVQLMYTGNACDVDIHMLHRMALIADRWLAPACHTKCIDAIRDFFTTNGTPVTEQHTDALMMCFGNVHDILNISDVEVLFSSLPIKTVRLWLRSNSLCADSENSVMIALLWWFDAQTDLPSSKWKKLLRAVRLSQLTTSFVKLIRHDELYGTLKTVATAEALYDTLALESLGTFRHASMTPSNWFKWMRHIYPDIPRAWISKRVRVPPAAAETYIEWAVPVVDIPISEDCCSQISSPSTSVHGFDWWIVIRHNSRRAVGDEPDETRKLGVYLTAGESLVFRRTKLNRMPYLSMDLSVKSPVTGTYDYEVTRFRAWTTNKALMLGWSDYLDIGAIVDVVEQLKPFTCADGMIHLRARIHDVK